MVDDDVDMCENESLLNNNKNLNMESCFAVGKEIESVLSKFEHLSEQAKIMLADMSSQLENLNKDIQEAPPYMLLTPAQSTMIKQILDRVKENLFRLTADHKDLHDREDVFRDPKNTVLLNRIIIQHLQYKGMDEIADTFVNECGMPKEIETVHESYNEIRSILSGIQKHNIEPALNWAITHSAILEAKNSSLEFKLHRLAFLQVIARGVDCQIDAIKYARLYFHKFVKKFSRDIQMLMGMLMYLPHGLKHSPYSHLLLPELWIEAAHCFVHDACSVLGLNAESPLTLSINAGCTALPALQNIKQVMQSRQVLGIWNGRDELPIEIDLGPDNRYHSVFACPILRQQSTEENPPMKLVCGHVISRDALNKLCNGSKLKCPYCPMEQSPSDARLVFF
ncbi:protein RMD5 homolog A isoform X2 [Ctenocephalides felis]|uniref:protein RMD5 homolog A isoform X2 n=1 Tax=Ctenocephalides felis TaxID=7515 RepID=UPI000E6E3F6E|nr:protein RMD5 homolog A isoform X2 [Ctenocephalides felis]